MHRGSTQKRTVKLTAFIALITLMLALEADCRVVPCRIQDRTQTAAQLEMTARRLTELLVTLDQTLGSTHLAKFLEPVGPAVQQARTGGKLVVNYTFSKRILLLVIALVCALIHRFLAIHVLPVKNSKSA